MSLPEKLCQQHHKSHLALKETTFSAHFWRDPHPKRGKVPISFRNYFLAAAPLPELRMALKKSDDGSITMTSLFLSKLAR